jgi:ribosomal protein L16 Arg81 hydroxylase
MNDYFHLDFGITPEEFSQTIFEKKTLHKKAAFDAETFGWSLIDNALDVHGYDRDALKVIKGGRVDPESYVEHFTDIGIRRSRIVKHELHRLLMEGATIVLNRIELSSFPAREFCLQVSQFIGARVTANSYASFGPEPATNVHWDTHDVVVLQTTGKKRWKIFKPTHELPLENHISDNHKTSINNTPDQEIILEAGDLLYIPRGWWHKVEPIEGYDTIHLTLAISVPMVLDYLIWLAANNLPEHAYFRHGLIGRDEEHVLIDSAANVIKKAMRDRENVEAFFKANTQNARVVSPFNIQGLIKSRDRTNLLQDTVILNSLSRDLSNNSLMINGTLCKFEDVHLQIINYLIKNGGSTVSSLASANPKLEQGAILEAINQMALADVLHVVKENRS